MVHFVDVVPESKEEKINRVQSLMSVPALRNNCSLKSWGILSMPIQEELRLLLLLSKFI
ncbi:hypothetical protein SLEP1_g14140 [Rubroshorea leprosula]|uniref:Uncharacterized protein n=1 Tax=Rubroshorea leprosula TaxID=152421 RepID=A0AAV5INX2_9ROSI|nr:hypothetical protein SLEP1_g14140 [Rubroshorea leprosula]